MSPMEKYIAYMEQTREQVKKNEKDFYSLWDQQVRTFFGSKDFGSMSSYISYDGGFMLSLTEYESMESGLKSFFSKRAICHNNRIILRGYDYYVNDPTMHKNIGLKDQIVLWEKFLEKWNNYSFPCAFNYLNEKICFQDWVGTLSMLEYVFSDLTTIRWFVFMTSTKLGRGKSKELAWRIDKYADKIGLCIALMLRFKLETAASIINASLKSIFADSILCKFLNEAGKYIIHDKPCVRAVREGDSLAKIYAAYLLKLLPFCEEKSINKLIVFSNAFGAMNAGVIIKYLLDGVVSVSAVNINYSTHRYYRSVFGPGSGYVSILSEKQVIPENYDAVIVLDDTVWTAGSYKKIKDTLKSKNIYLLPLSLDCNLLNYSTKKFETYKEMSDTSHFVNALAAEVGNTLPPFTSSWDREKKFNEWYEERVDSNFTAVMDGCDLLMQYLWYTYFDAGIKLDS